jgi:hypothetical protein
MTSSPSVPVMVSLLFVPTHVAVIPLQVNPKGLFAVDQSIIAA